MMKRVLALGFFDGVHLGHAALIRRTKERAEALGAVPAVLTFDVHPDTLVRGERVMLITSPEDRAELIRRLYGVEEILSLRFDRSLMEMPWDEFITWVQAEFSAVHLICGHDFSFGWKGEGDPARLQRKCAELGLGSDVIPKVTVDGETVSSTRIRALLLEGKLREANRLLGHPHALTDSVHTGYRLGRKLGTPTINMAFQPGVLVPAHGVYAGRLRIEGEDVDRWAVTNIGVRPTVSDGERVSVESYILDYEGNLYGRRVHLELLDFLRPERKFADTDALKAQIARDTAAVRAFMEQHRPVQDAPVPGL